MANVTIGQLTAIASAAANDVLEIETVGGLSRKITKANLIGAILVGGGTINTGGFTVNVTGNATLNGSYAPGANLYVHPNHSGDVTSVADGAQTIATDAVTTAKVINDAITNAKLANMVQATIKGRQAGAGSGDPEDLTAAMLRTILDITVGTWPVVVTSSGAAPNITATFNSGEYLRIHNLCFYRIVFSQIVVTAAGSGDMRFSLPFPSAAYYYGGVASHDGVDLSGTGTMGILFEPHNSGAYGLIQQLFDNGARTVMQTNAVATGEHLMMTGFYRIA